MTEHEMWMQQALELAREAAAAGEVPVGAVVIKDGQIIARARNEKEALHDATAHAEMEAIRQACAHVGDWRLDDCTMFVTLEPCPMCTGAIIQSRIPRIVFGAREPQTGSCGSVIDLFREAYGHSPAVYPGVLGDKSRELMQRFFREKREN